MKKLVNLVILVFSVITPLLGQEIPSFDYSQIYIYPQNDPWDGSSGSILDPANMYYNSYSDSYDITYVPVVSSNSIYIGSGEGILFSIYVPPYVSTLRISFNGSTAATQYCRVAVISEIPADSNQIPTAYQAGDVPDGLWFWKGVGDRTLTYDRDTTSSFFETGSIVNISFYNGANVDTNYDGNPDGNLQAIYDLGSFNVAWGISPEDSLNYVNWAHGIVTANSNVFINNDIMIYPNPATNFINVENVKQYKTIRIFNVGGELIKTINNKNNHIDISTLNSGVYIIKSGSRAGKFTKQ